MLVLLPLSLAACTSRGASAHRDPLTVVTAAARRMLTMSGFRYGLTAGSGETVSHGQGEIDLAGHRERLVLNVPTRNTTNGVATVTRVTRESIIIGDTIYAENTPPFEFDRCAGPGTSTPSSQRRFSATPVAVAGDAGRFEREGGLAGEHFVLAGIRSATHSASRIGTDAVRGVASTHYRVNLDTRVLVAQLPGSLRASARSAVAKDASLATTTLDVWVSSDGAITRVRAARGIGASPGQARAPLLLEFYDFGATVHVVTPPGNQVSELLRPPCFEPVGDWRVLGTGVTEGVSWHLFGVEAMDGGSCLAAETTPAPSTTRAPNAQLLPLYRGHRPWCSPGYSASEALRIVGDDGTPGGGPHIVFGLVAADTTGVMATFNDGSRTEGTLIGSRFVIVWRGTKQLRQVETTRPGGGSETCGPTRPSDDPVLGGGGSSCSGGSGTAAPVAPSLKLRKG